MMVTNETDRSGNQSFHIATPNVEVPERYTAGPVCVFALSRFYFKSCGRNQTEVTDLT